MMKIKKFLKVGMLLFVLLGLLTPASLPTVAATPRMSPELIQLASEAPDELVRVIIQKAGSSNEAESLVERFGGMVLKDLSLINAFAAEMSLDDAFLLAQNDSVQWVSLDAPVITTGKPVKDTDPLPETYFLDTLNVRAVWDMGYKGEGIGVAVIDSGISTDRDFSTEPGTPFTRIVKAVGFATDSNTTADLYGHGTHVAGIIGGHGGASDGLYSGIAPKIDLINLKISDDYGMAYESDTVEALQWIFDNKEQYNIRVVNLSVQSTVMMPYHESPLDAAAEILWFNGVVVVAASGNYFSDYTFNPVRAAPANDPFIITVGASNEKGSTRIQDDSVANFSAYGVTLEGYYKPEIYAPGKDIISVLANSSPWKYEYPDRVIMDDEYFRISGTSMAAPMVAGAAALLLQAEPNLTPDQVKYRLVHASESLSTLPYLNVYKALTTPTTESANEGIIPHMLLAKMALIAYWSTEECGETCDWENVDWGAVNWDSVNWDSVNWNSVNWNSVNWNSVNWNSVNWNSVNWNSVNWNSVNWNSVNWNSVNWNSVNWNSVNWNSVSWND
jgi:serine protease AprX